MLAVPTCIHSLALLGDTVEGNKNIRLMLTTGVDPQQECVAPEQKATYRHDPYAAVVLPSYRCLAKEVDPTIIIIPPPHDGVPIDTCDVGQEIKNRIDRHLNVHLELLCSGSLHLKAVKYVLHSVSQWSGLRIAQFSTTVKTKAFTLSMRFYDDSIVAFQRCVGSEPHLYIAKPAADIVPSDGVDTSAWRFSVYYGRRRKDAKHPTYFWPSAVDWYFIWCWSLFVVPFSHCSSAQRGQSSVPHARNKRAGNPYSSDSVAKRPRNNAPSGGVDVLPRVDAADNVGKNTTFDFRDEVTCRSRFEIAVEAEPEALIFGGSEGCGDGSAGDVESGAPVPSSVELHFLVSAHTQQTLSTA